MIHNVTIEKVAKHAGSIPKLSDIKQSAWYSYGCGRSVSAMGK